MASAMETSEDRRQHVRFVTSFEAEMIHGETRRKVTIGDISGGGALMRDAAPPRVGTKIRIKAVGLNMEASVRWSRNGLCGLRFSGHVDPLSIVEDNARPFQNIREKYGDLLPMITLPSLVPD